MTNITGKYVIKGTCAGCKYWIQLVPSHRQTSSDFIWNGLVNNATIFASDKLAANVMNGLKWTSKIPMEVVGI